MPIAINGSGSITGLSVGGLPDGTVDADTLAAGAASGTKLTLPSGTAVQMVQTYHNSQVTISGTSEQDYGLTATITPKTSGNKILVSMTGCLGSSATDNFGRGLFKVSVGGGSYSDIGAHFFLGNRMSHASKDVEVWTHDFLYTTSSASAHSFKLYYRVIDGGNMTIGGWSHDSNWLHRTVCTLTEVVA
tara:strand:- start:95 stop:661 length:567 start_codon:yes stop_codon:yes gene_type:complete